MAQRLNTKFLLILTAFVVVFAGLLVAAKFLIHRQPIDFAAKGDAAAGRGEWKEAIGDYQKAISLGHGDPALYVKCGSAEEHCIGESPDLLKRAQSDYENALVVDPGNLSAAGHLFALFIALNDVDRNPEHLHKLRDAADRVAKLDPSNQRALAYQKAATILLADTSNETGAREAEPDIVALAKMIRQDASDANLPWYYAQARLNEALAARKLGEVDSAVRITHEVASLFDNALVQQPDSADLNWRAFRVYAQCARLDPTTSDENTQKSEKAIARALKLAKPDDVHFAEILIAAASDAIAYQKPDEAEKILRTLLSESPNSGAGKLVLAGFLSRVRHDLPGAIALLSTPFAQDDVIGPRGLMARSNEAMRLFQLARFQSQQWEQSSDPTAKQKLLAAIDQEHNALKELVGANESVALLQVDAISQEVHGDPVAALGTYQRAIAVMDRSGAIDPELVYHAAILSYKEGQTGEAESMFQRVVKVDPTFASPMIALSELYLGENAPEKAQPYIDGAEKLEPNNPKVMQLRLRQLIEQKDFEGAKSIYAKLPESDEGAIENKAKMAMLVGNFADAVRLLGPLSRRLPDDDHFTAQLAQAYWANQQTDQAAALLKAALSRHPKSVELLLAQGQLASKSGDTSSAAGEEALAALEPFDRELIEARRATHLGDYSGAADHLAAADKLKPNDVKVQTLYFQLYIESRQFDLAKGQLKTLTDRNADNANGLLYLSQLQLAQGQVAEAVGTARALVAARPDFAQSYAMLGSALLADGQPDKAIVEFNNAISRQPENVESWLGLIDAYTKLNRPVELADKLSSATKLFPDDVSVRERVIQYDLVYSDHPEAAVDERQKLLNENPNSPVCYSAYADTALLASERLRGQTQNTELADHLVSEAEAVLDKGVARWPQDPSIVGLLSQVKQFQGDSAGAEKLLTDLTTAPGLSTSPQPWLLLYHFYQKAGRGDEAISAMQTAFEKSQHNVAIETQLAQALVDAHKFDAALNLLAANHPEDPAIRRRRLEVLVAAGRVDQALAEIADAVKASPDAIDLLNLQTATYIGAGRYADARPSAKAAAQLDSSNNDALFHQAVIELHLPDGDIDLARRDAEQLKLLNPSNPLAYGLLADVFYRLHQPSDAIRSLEEGLQAAPDDRNARLRLLDAYSQATPPDWSDFDRVVTAAESDPRLHNDPVWLVSEAHGLAMRQQYDTALAKMDQAIAIAPKQIDLDSEKLSILMDAKRYDDVVKATDQLISTGHKDWWIYMARGAAEAPSNSAQGQKDLDLALAAAPDMASSSRVIGTIAAAISPQAALDRAKPKDSDPAWRLITADLLIKKGDISGAANELEVLRTASNLTLNQKIDALTNLAESYTILHQPTNARDVYLQVLAISPDDPILLNNFASLLADDLKEPQEARKYSQKAYDMVRASGQDQPSIADTQGWVLTLCGGSDASGGLEILRNLVDKHQDFLDARYHLGEAYLRNSMPDDAVKQLEQAQMQIQQIESHSGRVNADLKSAIVDCLARARQGADGKVDAGGK